MATPETQSTAEAPPPATEEPPIRIALLLASSPEDRLGERPLSVAHTRTLRALERAYPVRFERVATTPTSDFDGLLVLGAVDAAIATELPKLLLPDGRRSDRAGATNEHADRSREVLMAEDLRLERPLRGRVLTEETIELEAPIDPGRAAVLASTPGRPVWWRLDKGAAETDVCAYPLAELGQDESLREHLRGGRFMGLLPLVSFLKRLLGQGGWREPPLRASFVVDDPNLHWRSYGFLDYRKLVAHATRHSYHVGFATVPLDGWFVEPRAAALLARNKSVLSLLIHGNNHVSRELGRLRTDAQAQPTIAQGLRRIASLERRSGVPVERVIVPPHGACSEAALRAAFRLGCEAACISRPYPWRDGLPAATPLAGWSPAELVTGGLAVLPRHPLSAPREDLVFRAILGQPLILYGHHGDFTDGLDTFEQAANDINSLGEARWGSLGSIARQSYTTRQLGDLLFVAMHARRVAIEVPSGARTLRCSIEEPFGGSGGHILAHAGGSVAVSFERGRGISEPLSLEGPRVELTLQADRPIDPATARSRPSGPWPLIRRWMVEARDRLQPLWRSA